MAFFVSLRIRMAKGKEGRFMKLIRGYFYYSFVLRLLIESLFELLVASFINIYFFRIN